MSGRLTRDHSTKPDAEMAGASSIKLTPPDSDLHARREAEIDHDDGQRIGQSVGKNRRPEVPAAGEVDASQDEPGNRGIDDARGSLIEVSQAEGHADHEIAH